MRQEANNTFQNGLVMDLHPLTTPNNVLTSCLNGTILTFNGNEYILQNDMGNGRVETAYLPAGYVPVGIVEFGGIVYIVSYNPLINKSQIGSFPSPERNISSDEVSKKIIKLSNGDFGVNEIKNEEGQKKYTTPNVFSVKKELTEDKLFPGDKFVVYAKEKGSIGNNFTTLYDGPKYEGNNLLDFLKLSLATITEEGKIVELTKLHNYRVDYKKGTEDKKGEYIIPEIVQNNSDEKPDIDSYRTIVSSPYNVFKSEVSGKLLLLAELLTINDYDVSVEVLFNKDNNEDNDNEDYNITLEVYREYETDTIPIFGYQESFSIKRENSNNSNEILIEEKWDPKKEDEEEEKFDKYSSIENTGWTYDKDKNPRDKDTITWTSTPCMAFGPIPYLTRSGSIDLSLVDSGEMLLTEWRYFIGDTIQLNWSLQTYPDYKHIVSKIRFNFYNPTNNETIIYKVPEKRSYNGSFTEIIPLDTQYYLLVNSEDEDNQSTQKLERNQLYLVHIEIYHTEIENSSNTEVVKEYFRWLYTSSVFNKDYVEYQESDFDKLQPKLTLTASGTPQFTFIDQNKGNIKLAKLLDTESKSEEQTLSALSNYYKLEGSLPLTPKLDNNYGVFDLDLKTIEFKANVSKGDIVFNSNGITSIKNDSINQEKLLELKVNENYRGGDKGFPENPEDLQNDPYNIGFYIEADAQQKLNSDNNYTIQISNIEIMEYIKGFASMALKEISYNGIIEPLVHNVATLAEHNMTVEIGTDEVYTIKCSSWGGFANYRHTSGDNYKNFSKPDTNGYVENNVPVDNIDATGILYFGNDWEQEQIRTYWNPADIAVGITTCYTNNTAYAAQNSDGAFVSTAPSGSSWGNVLMTINLGHNSITNQSKVAYCQHYENNKNDIGDFLALVFIKNIEDKYIPINMGSINISNHTHTLSQSQTPGYTKADLSELPFYGIENKSTGKPLIGGCRNLYTVLAVMLNQMYRYKQEAGTVQRYAPDDIHYMNNFTATYNINVNLEKNSDDYRVTIKNNDYYDENGNTIDKIKSKFGDKAQIKTNIESPTSYNTINLANVQPIIEFQDKAITIPYSSTIDGSELKLKLMEYINLAFTSLVITNKHEYKLNNISVDPHTVYYLDDDTEEIKKIDSNFKFRTLVSNSIDNVKFDPETENVEFNYAVGIINNWNFFNDSLEGKFKINDSGELRLNVTKDSCKCSLLSGVWRDSYRDYKYKTTGISSLALANSCKIWNR